MKRAARERLWAFLMARSLPGFEPGDRRVDLRPLDVPMPDGVILKADLLMPDRVPSGAPTVVIRTPYGRGALFLARMALPLASHGFPVLLQSVRGTFGSGGDFEPQVNEEQDGADTLSWVRRQPWFTGRLATTGESYLGYTQWAAAARLATEAPETASEAMSLSVTTPDFGAMTWDGGAFQLHTTLRWTTMMNTIERRTAILSMLGLDHRLRKALRSLPVSQADVAALGRSVPWFQDWVRHEDLRDEFWTRQSHTDAVARVSAPVLMVTGWQDLFLRWQMQSYEALVAAGRPPLLTIGPWGHSTDEGVVRTTVETIDFFRSTFLGVPSPRPAPVLFHLGGADEWMSAQSWPPDEVVERRLHLAEGGHLSADPPREPGASTRFVYDPQDPTPSTGEPPMLGAVSACDDAAHEERHDVVTFTGDPLQADVDVTGAPTVTVWLASDRPSADLFVRLTDVHPDGRSIAVCDGIRRVGSPATAHTDPARGDDGAWPIDLVLRPTAHRFLAGHRLRLQVSCGAYPRYARNNGTGRRVANDSELFVAHQEIPHRPDRVSTVVLPEWKH